VASSTVKGPISVQGTHRVPKDVMADLVPQCKTLNDGIETGCDGNYLLLWIPESRRGAPIDVPWNRWYTFDVEPEQTRSYQIEIQGQDI